MSNNSFTIYVKSAAQTIAGGSLFHGFSMAISQDSQGTDVDEMGVLVSGNPPKWFRGIVSYNDTAGWLILTDRSEGVLTNGTNYLSIIIDDSALGQDFIGNDNWADLDDSGLFPGRYYADVDNGATQMKTASVSGATVKVEIAVINDSEFDVATDVEGSIVREPIQPMGFDRGTQIYNDIIH